MTSDDKEVLNLLKLLTGQIGSCVEPLNDQAVGNALYGLQGMSSDHKEVLNLLEVLTDQVDRCVSSSR